MILINLPIKCAILYSLRNIIIYFTSHNIAIYSISALHSFFMFCMMFSGYTNYVLSASCAYFIYDYLNIFDESHMKIETISYIFHHTICIICLLYFMYNKKFFNTYKKNIEFICGMIELSSFISHIQTVLLLIYPNIDDLIKSQLKFCVISTWILGRLIIPIIYYNIFLQNKIMIITFIIIYTISLGGLYFML